MGGALRQDGSGWNKKPLLSNKKPKYHECRQLFHPLERRLNKKYLGGKSSFIRFSSDTFYILHSSRVSSCAPSTTTSTYWTTPSSFTGHPADPETTDSISEFEEKHFRIQRHILIDIIFTDLVSRQRRLSTLLLTRKRSPRKILSSRPRSSHRFF